MNILNVNTFDLAGGAARAAYRLHAALIAAGVDSQMLVQGKASDAHSIYGPSNRGQKLRGMCSSLLDEWPLRRYPFRTKTLFSPAWAPSGTAVSRINAFKPDIVHLHWVNNGMLRVEDIAKITAPVVWSLHDMWPFTGGCHYDEYCDAFTRGCGNCKVLGSSGAKDLSARNLQRKLRVIRARDNITVVGLSKWLAKQAARSSVFRGKDIRNLPNPIDTEAFSPFDKFQARKLMGLPQDKNLILFGAMGATSDPRKGFYELSQALRHMNKVDTELVIFGSSSPPTPHGFGQKAHYLGQIHDDPTLRALYSAADVTVVPSLQENLSNAIIESLACGTPVVCFDVGGNADMIDHGLNGYLSRPLDVMDLAFGIEWALDRNVDNFLSNNAVGKVRDCFESKMVAQKYVDLYMELLNQ